MSESRLNVAVSRAVFVAVCASFWVGWGGLCFDRSIDHRSSEREGGRGMACESEFESESKSEF